MRQLGRAVQFRYRQLHGHRGWRKSRRGWVGRMSALTRCTETFLIDELLGASDTHRFASVGCLTREPLSAIGFQRNLQKLCLTHCLTTERLAPQVFGRHEPTCMSDTQGANGVYPSDFDFGADPHTPEKLSQDHQSAKQKRGRLTKWRPRLG